MLWTRASIGTYTHLEPTANGPPITRTVALFIQAPAQDPLVCSSTRQCWLELCVSCTIVRRCCDCIQRVRRRLQMFRPDSTRNPIIYTVHVSRLRPWPLAGNCSRSLTLSLTTTTETTLVSHDRTPYLRALLLIHRVTVT